MDTALYHLRLRTQSAEHASHLPLYRHEPPETFRRKAAHWKSPCRRSLRPDNRQENARYADAEFLFQTVSLQIPDPERAGDSNLQNASKKRIRRHPAFLDEYRNSLPSPQQWAYEADRLPHQDSPQENAMSHRSAHDRPLRSQGYRSEQRTALLPARLISSVSAITDSAAVP